MGLLSSVLAPSGLFPKTGGDIDGNVNFAGIARRITGDFSNALIANRLAFQTNVPNANSSLSLLPNGTAGVASYRAYAASDPTNASLLDLAVVQGSDARITSAALGAGATLPLTFYTGNAERLRIDPTTGNVSVQSGSLICGNGRTSAFPPAAIAVNPTVHATSKRAAISIGSWIIGQDSNGDGARDIFFYDSAAGASRARIWPNGQFEVGKFNILPDSGAIQNGPLRQNYTISGTAASVSANKWYRIAEFPNANPGQFAEFIFNIPNQHVLMKVKFGKATFAGNTYQGGFLEVELLGSFVYGYAHPYKWRVIDNGTNGASYIDVQFPSGTDASLSWMISVLSSYCRSNEYMPILGFTDVGSAAGAGTRNYGVTMGSGDAWTMQRFKLNSSNGRFGFTNLETMTEYSGYTASVM